MKKSAVLIRCTLIFALPIWAFAAATEPADTAGLNGKIYTVDPEQPWAEAIAIKGKDIVCVADD